MEDYINRKEAIRLIMEYQGGAMDKPTAKKVLENMDGVEICEDAVSRQAAIKALDDILRVFHDLGLSCAYDMPSFWYNNKKDYKVIPAKYHKGYQQALDDAEKKIKKILEELCYG